MELTLAAAASESNKRSRMDERKPEDLGTRYTYLWDWVADRTIQGSKEDRDDELRRMFRLGCLFPFQGDIPAQARRGCSHHVPRLEGCN